MRIPPVLIVTVLILILDARAVGEEAFVGRWFGELRPVGGQPIPTVLDVEQTDGSLVITRTHLNHGVFSEPIVNWIVEDDRVTLTPLNQDVPQSWIGRVIEGGERFEGQAIGDGRTLAVLQLNRVPVVRRMPGARTWIGTVLIPGRDFEIFRLTLARDGTEWKGEVSLLDRSLSDHPVVVEPTEDGLTIEIPTEPGIRLDLLSPGPLDQGAPTEVIGIWREAEIAASLMLSPAAHRARPDLLRPQQPRLGAPYGVRHDLVTHPLGHQLGVSLCTPRGAGPFPGVVLVFGKGAVGRNDAEHGHEFAHVWADLLARSGVASVRFDGRGFGQSTVPAGRSATDLSLDDAASDVRYLIEWLREQPSIDLDATGLVGWGDGGLVVMSAAPGLRREVQFLVLLSTAGVTIPDLLKWRMGDLLSQLPADEALAQNMAVTHATVLNVARDPAADEGEIREVVSAFLRARAALSPASPPVTAEAVDRETKLYTTPSYREDLRFDPGQYLPRVRCPILAVAGGMDTVIPSPLGVEALAAAAARTGRDIEIVDLPNLNHRLQPVDPGRPLSPESIRATVDPAAVETVIRWIRSRFDMVEEIQP